MKKLTLLSAATLVLAQGLMADYPRDAAQRFKMKYGIDHPVVVQETRDREAKLKKEEDKRQSQPQGNREESLNLSEKPDTVRE